MSTTGDSISWCTTTSACNDSGSMSLELNVSEDSNCKRPPHFCVRVLHDTIGHTYVRYLDMIVIIPIFLYFVFLTWCLLKKWKVIVKRPLLTVLFCFVYMITISGLVSKATAMSIGYHVKAYKVCALILRGFILVSEISVVTFGLFFRLYGKSKLMLLVTVALIILVGISFTATEGVLEFKKLRELPCSHYKFFTHGGMIFLFCTSVIFCIAYLTTFLIYLFRLHKKWNLPSRASFYYYTLILSVVNAVQAVGSMFWYEGRNEQHIGQSGICMVTLTTIIYDTTYVPMTYWIFLRNFLTKSRPTDASTSINMNDTGLLSNEGLLSKAKQKFLHSHGNYGTNSILNIAEEEEDSDNESVSGAYSSSGCNIPIT